MKEIALYDIGLKDGQTVRVQIRNANNDETIKDRLSLTLRLDHQVRWDNVKTIHEIVDDEIVNEAMPATTDKVSDAPAVQPETGTVVEVPLVDNVEEYRLKAALAIVSGRISPKKMHKKFLL